MSSDKPAPRDYPTKEDAINTSSGLKMVVIPRLSPALDIPGHGWGPAFGEVFNFLGNNAMAPTGVIKGPWLRPGPSWKGTWLFDDAFISRVWSLCNLDFAREVLDNCLQYQVTTEPDDEKTFGRIPHSITPNGIGPWAAPPLVDYAYWELFKKNGSVAMLQDAFTRLFDYHLWLNYNRDTNKDGLYSWVHPSESGLENAPRFDAVPAKDCDAVDLSCLVSIQLRSLINMAAVLKEDTVKENLETRKKELDGWINDDLWDPSTGFYYDKAIAGPQKGQFVGPRSIVGWYPLFAGIVPKDRLGQYLRHLSSRDEFWTTFPVPSVAQDDPAFDKTMNMWRGATWVVGNYMIIKGMKGYGFRQLPGELAYLTAYHVFETFKKKKSFFEYYNSIGPNDNIELFGRKSEKTGPRSSCVGSTGLVANILLEDMLGIESQHHSILLQPSVPDKFIAKLGGSPVTGSLPGIAGWKQDHPIDFKMTFNQGGMIEYEFTLANPMDIYVVEFSSKEKLFSGENVGIVQVEVNNNKDIISIFSNPESKSIRDEFLQKDGKTPN
nr:trehalase family glycosidase [Candidatus Sigynarchaeum springense]